MSAPHQLGRRGERLAENHLRLLGYTILDRNYRFGHREVDLVVRRGDLIAFVEVKARAGSGYGHPLAAITALKRREVERVARSWIHRHGGPGLSYRFDAVGVVQRPGCEPTIVHVPNAWRLGE
jgi:putative endonuclease